MATRQHYLSQCIIDNFISKDFETFLEYDCERKSSQLKNKDKLFSKYRSWDKWFEDELAHNFENSLAPVLKKYSSCDIEHQNIEMKDKNITIYAMNGYQIQDLHDCEILNKLFYQQILIQLGNRKDRAGVPDETLISLFTKTGSRTRYPAIFEFNPNFVKTPLILIDGQLFMFMAPVDDPTKIGHLCFFFPISENRFLIWGNEKDCVFFIRKYKNITYLNLCRIEQQSKQCRIASQNYDYMNSLIPMIEKFESGETIKITSVRDVDDIKN